MMGGCEVFVNVYVNDEDIRYLRGDQTPLREGDILSIVPSICSGTRIKSGEFFVATKYKNFELAGSGKINCDAVERRNNAHSRT